MKLTIGSSSKPLQGNQVLISPINVPQVLKVFGPSSFDNIETTEPLQQTGTFTLDDKELWKQLITIMKENAELHLHLSDPLTSQQVEIVTSLMKVNGFSNVIIQEKAIQAKKPQWQAAGAPLKRKQQQPAANPWAALKQTDGGLINEDELMKDDSSKPVYQKFCGEDDKVQAGKPCENCTCGRKELDEGKISLNDLENGNVESNCGKCYLGDAFRCASCPFLGKPAFEAGDKVQLKNSGNQQTQVESEKVQIKTTGNKVTLEL